MIYKQVSSKIIIANLFDSYNIDYSGFIPRVPNFIYRAMRELNIPISYINKTVSDTVADYKCAIPDSTQVLRAVSYKGYRLERIGKINEYVDNDMPSLYHDSFSYEIDNNGYIITSFEKGDIKFYIKTLSTTLDETTKLYFPNIPDDEKLFVGLEHYIIAKLLLRGHKVGEFSLKTNNPILNPMLAWNLSKKGIRNSINRFDADELDKYSKIKRTFIMNYDYFFEEAFNEHTNSTV